MRKPKVFRNGSTVGGWMMSLPKGFSKSVGIPKTAISSRFPAVPFPAGKRQWGTADMEIAVSSRIHHSFVTVWILNSNSHLDVFLFPFFFCLDVQKAVSLAILLLFSLSLRLQDRGIIMKIAFGEALFFFLFLFNFASPKENFPSQLSTTIEKWGWNGELAISIHSWTTQRPETKEK